MAGISVSDEAVSAPRQRRAGAWLANTFDSFRVPTYRVIWLGTILAFMAFNVSMTAQGVVAYDLTGSNRAVGTVLFGQGIAMLFLNPFGGAIADRFSKRLLMLIAQTVIGGVALATALMILTDTISIPFLAAGAFVVGSMFAFLGPTRTALLGEYVAAERMGNAMALIQVGGNFARISGPFIAGALLAWPLVGAAGTYFFITAIFVFVIVTLYQIPPSKVKVRTGGSTVLSDVKAGFRHIYENPRLLHAIGSFHIVTVLGVSYIVIIPGFAIDTLGAGTGGVGALLGCAAAGGLVTSIIVAGLADSKKAPLYLSVMSFCLGVALFVTGFAPTLPWALLGMALVGASSSAFQTLNNVVALRFTQPAFFGRVVGLMFLAWGLNSLATLPVGFLADAFGERAVLSALGVALCAVSVVLGVWGRVVDARLGSRGT